MSRRHLVAFVRSRHVWLLFSASIHLAISTQESLPFFTPYHPILFVWHGCGDDRTRGKASVCIILYNTYTVCMYTVGFHLHCWHFDIFATETIRIGKIPQKRFRSDRKRERPNHRKFSDDDFAKNVYLYR